MARSLLSYDVRQMARGSRTFSARWGADVLARLERRSESTGTNKSRLAERYVDEGVRMDEHPGIVFRPGPAGRRAALAWGPDVWQVIATLRGLKVGGEEAIAAAAEILNLGEFEMRIATRYYDAFPDDIDKRIAANVEGADEAEAAWLRDQAARA
jgi:hypothetical protein